MNILYFVMGLLFLSVGLNVVQYWLTEDLRHVIYNLSSEIIKLKRHLENAETNERSIYDD